MPLDAAFSANQRKPRRQLPDGQMRGEFTPEGGRIELAAVPKDGCVEVSVSDTGVGIAPENQEKVFEEFRQVEAADKKAEGTGLGLTLCRKFIELRGQDLGEEPARGGFDVHPHDPGAPRRVTA